MAELSRIMGDFLADAAADRGESRVYKLKPNQHIYRYVGRVARTRYCYTQWADTNGDYWAFNEVIRYHNAKAKVGELVERTERTKWVRCATRSSALKRAQRRYNTAAATARKRRQKVAA
jgi:hypothetical protein